MEAVEQAARLVARDALAFSMPAGKFIIEKVRSAAKGVIEANAGSDDETISEAVAGLRSVVAMTDRALEAGSLDLDGCREVLRHLNIAVETLQANASVDVAEQASLPWNRPVAQEREETIARMRRAAGLPAAKFAVPAPIPRCKTYADPSPVSTEALSESEQVAIMRRRAGLRGAPQAHQPLVKQLQTGDGRVLTETEAKMRRIARMPVIEVSVPADGSTVGKKLLVETIPAKVEKVLNEVAGEPLHIRSVINTAGVRNGNGRSYPRQVLVREAAKLQARVDGGQPVFGLVDHPDASSGGVARLRDAGLRWLKFEMKGDQLCGEAEVLNTAAGRDLRQVLASTGKVGISSRGFGTTRKDSTGTDVVQEDFDMQGADCVIGQSSADAWGEVAR